MFLLLTRKMYFYQFWCNIWSYQGIIWPSISIIILLYSYLISNVCTLYYGNIMDATTHRLEIPLLVKNSIAYEENTAKNNHLRASFWLSIWKPKTYLIDSCLWCPTWYFFKQTSIFTAFLLKCLNCICSSFCVLNIWLVLPQNHSKSF